MSPLTKKILMALIILVVTLMIVFGMYIFFAGRISTAGSVSMYESFNTNMRLYAAGGVIVCMGSVFFLMWILRNLR
ncbi:MAG: hypothetical protein Q4D13_06800 [Erysipelotrichaceae bacterium]|nr:hypothetical protein [Erysipelotrichaceae bacterium]